MSTRVLLLPGALEDEDGPPLFERTDLLPSRFEVIRRVVSGAGATPEVAWIGLDPERYSAAAGPLMVAALGADPPDRSVHLQLNLMSFRDGKISLPDFRPTEDEAAQILAGAKRLETTRLKLVAGFGFEHGLVWEDGSLEIGLTTPEEAAVKGYSDSLPQGDGESMFRRFIDDSINLLSPLEVNGRREEEGLPPLNLLWPWGAGFRPAIPNLTLERGSTARIESPSVRLKGLARLAGYRSGIPWDLGSGTGIRLEKMAESIPSAPIWLGVVPAIGELRQQGKLEEAGWLAREVGTRLGPCLLPSKEGDLAFLVATDSEGMGLAAKAVCRPGNESRALPFCAEVARSGALPVDRLHEWMAEVLAG